MTRSERLAGSARRMEGALLALFLLGQLWHLNAQNGQVSGFDAGDYLFRVGQMTRGDMNPDLHASFWAYHPPLTFFLVGKAQRLFAISDARAAQVVSQAGLLLAFFTLRATLARLGQLATGRGIAFLYIACTLPITVHAATSVNMDILILGFTGLALLLSVCLWERPARNRTIRLLLGGSLALTVTAALFTKFSGLLIGAIPLGIALAQTPARARRGAAAVGIVLTGTLLAAPYYTNRYYRTTGSFFPNVNEWWYTDELRAARARRDADRVGFLTELLRPRNVPRSAADPTRDKAHHRLEDTWRDLWFKDPLLGPTSPQALRAGRLYAWVFGGGAPIGLAVWLRRRRRDAWDRLGYLLLSYSSLQLLALIAFIYQQPIADYVPDKALYILPATWGLTYLLTGALPQAESRAGRLRAAIGLALIGAFLGVNLWLPAY